MVASAWSDRPVVAVQSVTLPDVYMCLPAAVVAKFTLKDKNQDKDEDQDERRRTAAGHIPTNFGRRLTRFPGKFP